MRSLDGGGPIPPPPSLSLPSRSEKGASLGAASCAATTAARREAKRLASNVETSRTGGTMWQLALLVGLGRDAISALAPIAGSSAVRQRNGSGGGYVRFPFPPQPSSRSQSEASWRALQFRRAMSSRPRPLNACQRQQGQQQGPCSSERSTA